MPRILAAVYTLWILLGGASLVVAAEWPDGFIVEEESHSPDEHFGILIPNEEPEKIENFLVDLRTHRKLGRIVGSKYFEGESRSGLEVTWAPNSTWCLVNHEGRFEFNCLTVVEVVEGKLRQIDLAKFVSQALRAALAKKTKDNYATAFAYARLGNDRKLHLRAMAETVYKQMDDRENFTALFQGTFDAKSRKWSQTGARTISEAAYSTLIFGYAEEGVPARPDESPAQSLERLLPHLTALHLALKEVLPPRQWQKVDRAQQAWLKAMEATHDPAEKVRLALEHQEVLQESLW